MNASRNNEQKGTGSEHNCAGAMGSLRPLPEITHCWTSQQCHPFTCRREVAVPISLRLVRAGLTTVPAIGRPSVGDVIVVRRPRHNRDTKRSVERRSRRVRSADADRSAHWQSQCHTAEPRARIRHSSLDIRHSSLRCRSAQQTQRVGRGFTLVEILIVIVIISVLASLLLVAVNAALRSARVAAIKAEIEGLANAVEEYKNERGAYPMNPTFLAPPGPTLGAAQSRFERHIRKAFPRYTGNYDTGNPNDIRPQIAAGTISPGIYPDGLDIGEPGVDPPMLMNLDAAEALVFWLGGLPVWTIGASGKPTVELTGFSLTSQNPFQHRDVQPQRTGPLFEFRPERLTDYDQDGWPEYIPPGRAGTGEMPPYVYFDSGSYGMQAQYPLPGSPLRGSVGLCIPFLTSYVEMSGQPPNQNTSASAAASRWWRF